jgi:hypothetical protein
MGAGRMNLRTRAEWADYTVSREVPPPLPPEAGGGGGGGEESPQIEAVWCREDIALMFLYS